MSKKRFLLRIDPELYRLLEKWAGDELRSVNGQIEFLLKQAAVKAGRTKLPGEAGSAETQPDADDAAH